MHAVLEAVHRDLAEHRGDLTLEALGEQREALRRGRSVASSSRPKVTVSPNTDAVSASVSGVVWWKIALLAGQVRVQAVAQLVGEREHVAPPARSS